MKTLQHKFVEAIPVTLDQDTLYISMEYATAVHLCICGCGNEVVTPFSPTDWKLTFDGETISLDPSIGNWNFPCQSHYYIVNSQVRMSSKWSSEEIDLGRKKDARKKKNYFQARKKAQNKPRRKR
jgi:hypothetical protein